MPKIVPALIAEAIGVFALSFLGILALRSEAEAGVVGVALAYGLIVAIMISVFGSTSGGHFNPAVTIGMLVGGKIKGPDAVLYILAQLAGGFLAGVAVIAIFGQGSSTATQAAHYGAEIVRNGTPSITRGFMGACIIELVATFLLVTAYWGTSLDPRAPKIAGFGIGLTITANTLAIGKYMVASMNPARAFGPALAANIFGASSAVWEGHWVFWVAPILGGILASVIYMNFIWPKNRD